MLPGGFCARSSPGSEFVKDEPLWPKSVFQKQKAQTPKSWTVDAKDVDLESYDLSAKNPNEVKAASYRTPQEIIDEIASLDAESAKALQLMRSLL